MNCVTYPPSPIGKTKQEKTQDRFPPCLQCLGDMLGSGRGYRRMTMENIGENQRNTKMQNDVFEPKMAYLLDNNKTEGTTDASPVFLLRRSTAT